MASHVPGYIQEDTFILRDLMEYPMGWHPSQGFSTQKMTVIPYALSHGSARCLKMIHALVTVATCFGLAMGQTANLRCSTGRSGLEIEIGVLS